MSEANSNGIMEPLDIPADHIPWYRMRWFFVVTLLLFIPATLVIGLSGNIYGKHQGELFKLADKTKYMIMAVGSFLMLSNIIRFL